MASKQFLDAIRKARSTTKNLDELVVGSRSQYLAVDKPHDVYIKAIDTSKLDTNNFVNITYADAADKEHSENIFLVDREGNLEYRLRLILSALFGSADTFATAVDAFLGAVADGNEAWGMLTGMKMRVTLGTGRGFRVDRRADATFVPVDAETGETLPELDAGYESVDAARSAAEARGHKRSFPRVKKTESLGDDVIQSNADALRNAVEGRQKAKAGTSRTGTTDAGTAKKSTTLL